MITLESYELKGNVIKLIRDDWSGFLVVSHTDKKRLTVTENLQEAIDKMDDEIQKIICKNETYLGELYIEGDWELTPDY